eukprot:4981621-Pyramimonas_sp.AAC.1
MMGMPPARLDALLKKPESDTAAMAVRKRLPEVAEYIGKFVGMAEVELEDANAIPAVIRFSEEDANVEEGWAKLDRINQLNH